MNPPTLLFTDVVDSTLLVERVGDVPAAQVWAEHDRRARALIAQHQGREIDRTDGFFLLFDSVLDAARFALAYHATLRELELGARVGVHVGAVTLRENAAADVARGAKPIEVEGLAKPFAARVMALARGGQTLFSASAHDALNDTVPETCLFESHGHYRLKGVETPVELFELGLQVSCAFAPPHDTDKAYRVVRTGELWLPLRAVPHNLPAERDSFVGRTAELRLIAQRLDAGARLLTVLGPGGTGKTRFVCRYGWSWLGDWPGGVCFCDLSEARTLDGIFFAVAVALDVPLGKDGPAAQLGHAIAGRGRCLIVLDNFEQVVHHAAATVGAWADRAARAAFVCTSRERLHLPGEEVFAIEPLPLEKDAVDLFADRARAQRADFTLGDDNRAAVTEVVRLLDGLPLAIELAASRVRLLSPEGLVKRMRDRFQVLAGASGPSARQATLRAAIDWSWDLLAPWEQTALAQCSVFEGGFTLDAAEAVLDLSGSTGAPATLDVIHALVDKSLLRSLDRAGRGRYDVDEPYFGMYLSIHDYATEMLRARGIAQVWSAERRHLGYFAGFGAESALERLRTHGGAARRRALIFELDNLVVACRRAVGNDDEAAVATYRAAWEVLEHRGPFALGVALGAQVLAAETLRGAPRVEALVTLGRASRRSGRVAQAHERLEQALALCRAMHEPQKEGRVLCLLGDLHREQGRMDDALIHLERSLVLLRAAGDRGAEGIARDNLGNLYKERGELEHARAHYDAALAIQREVGNRRAEGIALANLGLLHWDQGRAADACACYAEALAAHRETANRPDSALVLGNLGNVFFEQGRNEEARTHYDAALALHREVGNRRGEGIVLGNLGNLHREEGRLAEARAHYEASLAVHREVGNRRSQGIVLGNLGTLHHEQGRVQEASAHIQEALDIHRAMGNRLHQGVVLGCLGAIFAEQHRYDDARAVLREGEVLLREAGDPLQLSKLLCVRGSADVALGDRGAAWVALAEADAVAAALGAGPDSDLGRESAKLRDALA